MTLVNTCAIAKEPTGRLQTPNLDFSGFLEVYYGFDFNQPADNERPDFVVNHHRHNEVNVNLGLLQARVDGDKYRANVGLMVGTYSQQNLAHEPRWLRNIFSANFGLALDKQNSLWLDVGVFPSHIGFESAISADNPTLTRSLVAENSPYYLAGAKLTWHPHPKWELAGLVINGWQRIKPVSGSSLPSFGTQVAYTPNDRVKLNWSTFIGTDDPDETRRMRYFNNGYVQYQATEKLDLIAGLDVGVQQTARGSSEYNLWLGAVAIAHYDFSKRWAMAVRGEYYQDESEVIITTKTGEGFETAGFSINVDYNAYENILCRLETRWLISDRAVFVKDTALTRHNGAVIGSVALRF